MQSMYVVSFDHIIFLLMLIKFYIYLGRFKISWGDTSPDVMLEMQEKMHLEPNRVSSTKLKVLSKNFKRHYDVVELNHDASSAS